jgi:DNA-binding transcriptional regulator GbsR (MarR family)
MFIMSANVSSCENYTFGRIARLSKKLAPEEQRQIDEEREVLKKLVVDEREVIKSLADLVERAKSVFSIASPGGKIIFQDFGGLSDERRILVLLLGKYFALRLGFVETADLGISEIAEELGRPKTALSGDVGTLIKDGLVEKMPDRSYRIAYNRIRDIFNKILADKTQAPQKVGLPGVPARGTPSLYPTFVTPDSVISEVFPGLNLPKERRRSKKRPPEKVERDS